MKKICVDQSPWAGTLSEPKVSLADQDGEHLTNE